MRTRAPFIALLAALASLVPALAFAGPWLPARGEYYSELQAGSLSSHTFYDAVGTRYFFPLDDRIQSRSINFYNEMGWKKWASLVIAAPIRSTTRRTANFAYSNTETGLGDLNLGVRFKLRSTAPAAALQLVWSAPLGYETRTDSLVGPAPTRDSVLSYAPRSVVGLSSALGTGRQSLTARLELGTELKRLDGFVELAGGYRLRSDPYQDQLVASARAGRWFGSSLLVLGHYDGELSSGQQESLINGRVPLVSLGRVKTEFNFVETTEHVVGPEIRYRVDDRLDVYLGSNHSMSGKNSLHRDEYYVGMAFRQSKHNRLQGLLGNKTRP